jgi:energy-coupling factor transporter transmembrane protein EcfT
MAINKKMNNSIDYFNLKFNSNQIRIILIIVIILIIILLFRKKFHSLIERFIVFTIIFLLFLIISKNLVVTFIGTCIIFLLVNLIMKYRDTIEKFESVANAEPPFDTSIFDKSDVKKSGDNIQELLKKINGGIELKDSDVQETDIIKDIDLTKHSDDKRPNALKDAQKETYELINTVNALKDTITTLSPVLQEGKKLMNIFENLKI